jgi:hypothetical protein
MTKLDFIKYIDFQFQDDKVMSANIIRSDWNIIKEHLMNSENDEGFINLPFHHSVWINSCQMEVTRVMDGWIYRSYDPETGKTCVSSVFVPLNRET